MAQARQRSQMRLPPEVNRALYVRNLPFKITSEEMYDIFGKFGAIRQVAHSPRARSARRPPRRAPARTLRAPCAHGGCACSQIRLGNASDTRGTAFVVYEVACSLARASTARASATAAAQHTDARNRLAGHL